MICFCAIPVYSQEEKGRAYYDFGVFSYEDGDYADAVENFKKAIELEPDNPEYHHFLGKTFMKTGRLDKAREHFVVAFKKNPGLSGLKYDIAQLNFKEGDFAGAASLFRQVVHTEPSNVLAHYYAGIALLKNKQYSDAVEPFLAAAERSPSIKAHGFFYAGICHTKDGQFDKARTRFEYVKTHAESEKLRNDAKQWLEAIDRRKTEQKPYTLYLKTGLTYDDNVPLEPIDQDVYTDEKDWVGDVYLSASYQALDWKGIGLDIGYNHYQSWHFDLSEYDLTGSIGNIRLKYRYNPLSFGLSYMPSYYWLARVRYMTRHQIRPDVVWKINREMIVRGSYSYYVTNNFQSDDRDSHASTASLDGYYILKKGYLFGGIDYEKVSAAHNNQKYYQSTAKLGLSLPMPWEFNLGISGRYYDKKYEHADTVYGVKRNDERYTGTLSVSRKLFYEGLELTGEYSYTENDSNVNVFKYKRNTASVSMSLKY